MSVPLVDSAGWMPCSAAQRISSSRSGRSNGSPPERIRAGTWQRASSRMRARPSPGLSSSGWGTLWALA
ncbi:MAG: hypothetical protein A2X52_11410 [Candidatus Rokubacteria bacterium GWC2_70_16]|nr:MAG: hypothetical protein A2X52_11410 [Candidatus Rokubacteria bacterium GWC2_70_16]